MLWRLRATPDWAAVRKRRRVPPGESFLFLFSFFLRNRILPEPRLGPHRQFRVGVGSCFLNVTAAPHHFRLGRNGTRSEELVRPLLFLVAIPHARACVRACLYSNPLPNHPPCCITLRRSNRRRGGKVVPVTNYIHVTTSLMGEKGVGGDCNLAGSF